MKRYHFLQAFFVELHDDHPVSFYEWWQIEHPVSYQKLGNNFLAWSILLRVCTIFILIFCWL
jgi:hypothetical protein